MYRHPGIPGVGVGAGGGLAYTGFPLIGTVVAGTSLLLLGAALVRLARRVPNSEGGGDEH